MNMQSILDYMLPWSGSVILSFFLIVVLFLIRVAFNKRNLSLDRDSGSISQMMIFVLVVMVAIIAVILSLPIGENARGQLLSLFGLLITAIIALSSTTFVGNAMAGMMLKALHNFRPGDFVRVGDHFGRVSEVGLLHTEIQTEDRDLTTLPNLHLVANPITVLRSSGTIISAEVSLGYDVPRKDIERQLIVATERVKLEAGFVHIRSLGDFSITYRAAGFYKDVKYVLSKRSQLRSAILDALHEAGIEIVSPSFMNQRQLKSGIEFIPKTETKSLSSISNQQSVSSDVHNAPETMIFDKAEHAESVADNKDELNKLLRERDELKKEIGKESDDKTQLALKHKEQSLEKEIDTLQDSIDSKIKERT